MDPAFRARVIETARAIFTRLTDDERRRVHDDFEWAVKIAEEFERSAADYIKSKDSPKAEKAKEA